VDVTPDDSARREALEQWAEKRQALAPRTRRARLQLRLQLEERRLVSRLERGSQRVDRALERLGDRLLDTGFDTATRVYLHDFARDDRTPYVPSAWHLLPRALRHVGVSERDTFVDFGCGKGRAVQQAARRPFHRVIGVEVSPELAAIARAGLAARRHRRRCQNVEIVVADVTQWHVPDDLTIGYFFRPFGDDTLAPVLRSIVESMDRNPRPVRLIYVWPTDRTRSVICATDRFRIMKEQSSSLTNPWAAPVIILESH
jgi:hypothetical protein